MSKYILKETVIVEKEIELLPCPHCGRDDTQVECDKNEFSFNNLEVRLRCMACGHKSPVMREGSGNYSEDQLIRYAINAWNVNRKE